MVRRDALDAVGGLDGPRPSLQIRRDASQPFAERGIPQQPLHRPGEVLVRESVRVQAHAQAGLFLVDADRPPPQTGAGRLNVTLRMYLEPREEFRQIFHEGWRNQRDYLYVTNAHGADWKKAKEMYGALLPYVNHRADLNYLLDNMGAELAVGHSYVRGGEMPGVP